jgi:hypothetical protein
LVAGVTLGISVILGSVGVSSVFAQVWSSSILSSRTSMRLLNHLRAIIADPLQTSLKSNDSIIEIRFDDLMSFLEAFNYHPLGNTSSTCKARIR